VGTGFGEVGNGGVEHQRGQQEAIPTFQNFDLKQNPLPADYFCNNDELQKIFEDLFNDPEDPIDFDQFCNEIIDEELASDEQQQSRDTTPSPVEETTFESQTTVSNGFYEEPLPENVLCENGCEEVVATEEAYGGRTLGYPAVSPSQQVPSPSNMYTGNFSPISVKEETFYTEQKFADSTFEQSMPNNNTTIWESSQEFDYDNNTYTLVEDGQVSFVNDPFLLPYEDVLISSDNLWVDNIVEA